MPCNVIIVPGVGECRVCTHINDASFLVCFGEQQYGFSQSTVVISWDDGVWNWRSAFVNGVYEPDGCHPTYRHVASPDDPAVIAINSIISAMRKDDYVKAHVERYRARALRRLNKVLSNYPTRIKKLEEEYAAARQRHVRLSVTGYGFDKCQTYGVGN